MAAYLVNDRPAASAGQALGIASRLLLAGVPVVHVLERNDGPTCWDSSGRHSGEWALLQRLAPAECSVAPAGHWSTAAFPPYFWRQLPQLQRLALPALV